MRKQIVLIAALIAVTIFTIAHSDHASHDNWVLDVERQNSSCVSGNVTEPVQNIGYTGNDPENGTRSVSFTGYIQAANPCEEIVTEVEKTGEDYYVLRVETESSDQICVQCAGVAEYDASFQTDRNFRLEVRHGNETVKMIDSPVYNGKEDQERGMLEAFLDWLSKLF